MGALWAATKQTDLVYFGFRHYSPEMGRFITRDPIGEAGGLNLYRFVDNDPVNSVDRWGLINVSFHVEIGWVDDDWIPAPWWLWAYGYDAWIWGGGGGGPTFDPIEPVGIGAKLRGKELVRWAREETKVKTEVVGITVSVTGAAGPGIGVGGALTMDIVFDVVDGELDVLITYPRAPAVEVGVPIVAGDVLAGLSVYGVDDISDLVGDGTDITAELEAIIAAAIVLGGGDEDMDGETDYGTFSILVGAGTPKAGASRGPVRTISVSREAEKIREVVAPKVQNVKRKTARLSGNRGIDRIMRILTGNAVGM